MTELPRTAEASSRAPKSCSYLAGCSAVSRIPTPDSRTRPWANWSSTSPLSGWSARTHRWRRWARPPSHGSPLVLVDGAPV